MNFNLENEKNVLQRSVFWIRSVVYLHQPVFHQKQPIKNYLALSARATEYTDCITTEG